MKKISLMLDNKELWEIFVPTVRNNGKPIHTRFHRVWDKKVEGISGGMTIYHPAHGRWIHGAQRYAERMIPVRIMCTEEQMKQIAEFTVGYYDQIEVLAYRISDKIIRYRME
jgi:hypothetical protein